MSHAQKCPVCNGSGKYNPARQLGSIYEQNEDRTCHGCMGRGWIVIESLDLFSPFQFVITKAEQPSMEDLR